MKDIFGEIVEKYTGMKDSKDESESYLFTPDIDPSDDVREPYMDRLSLKRGKLIGINTKTLYLSRISDWSSYKISKNAKIRELIVETTDIPENLFTIDLNLDWIKFKFLKIKTLNNFEKLKSNSIAFDKCKFDGSVLDSIKEANPGLNKLSIIACEVDNLDLSKFGEFEELQLVYTVERGTKLQDVMNGVSTKKLVISGDLLSDKETKSYINSLKSRGVKVEIVGPVI